MSTFDYHEMVLKHKVIRKGYKRPTRPGETTWGELYFWAVWSECECGWDGDESCGYSWK